MYDEILDRLLSFPQRCQIKIDFDEIKRVFRLSVPIFSSKEGLAQSVKNYVDARKNSTFKPHVTSFESEGNQVFLKQEIPFHGEFQDTLRLQADLFWQMSRKCHRMLSELFVEERYKSALYGGKIDPLLDDDSQS
jgi:hypothetical protein